MTDSLAHSNPSQGNWGDRFKLRLSAIVWFLLAAAFVLSLPVLLDISWLLLLSAAVLALILCFPAAWLVRKLFRGQQRQSWWASVVKAFLALLFSACTAMAAPLYYLGVITDLRPMTVPQATLSNGSKTVVFQGMSHIGSEGFYKSVVYDLEQALVDGYVLYYEGVRGSADGDEWFSKTLAGGGDLSANYKMFGDICGLKFQLDYFGLLQADMTVHPGRHVSADVTTADMMHEYERLVQTDPAFAAAVQPAPADGIAAETSTAGSITNIIGWLQQGSPELRKVAGIACRGYLTMVLGGPPTPDAMDKVVVDFRNRALTDRITSDARELIYITYGANHLKGLLAMLQESDPAWTIKSLKWMQTIAAPEELDGQL